MTNTLNDASHKVETHPANVDFTLHIVEFGWQKAALYPILTTKGTTIFCCKNDFNLMSDHLPVKITSRVTSLGKSYFENVWFQQFNKEIFLNIEKKKNYCWLIRAFPCFSVNFSLEICPHRLTFTWWGCYGLCQRHKSTKLAHSFLFCSCVCFSLMQLWPFQLYFIP